MSILERAHFREYRRVALLALLSVGMAQAGGGDPRVPAGLQTPKTPGALPLSDSPALPQEEAAATPSPWWTRFYGAGLFDTRWDGWFIQSFLQQGYDLKPNRLLSLYGIGWLTGGHPVDGSGPRPDDHLRQRPRPRGRPAVPAVAIFLDRCAGGRRHRPDRAERRRARRAMISGSWRPGARGSIPNFGSTTTSRPP